MKRWLLYFAMAAAVAVLSGRATAGQEIGKLQPVQTVTLSVEQGMVVLQTDTGDRGVGANLPEAVKNMNAAATGEVFLETADYLLLSPECIDLLPVMGTYLRPSCSLCLMKGQPDMERVGAFLEHHQPENTLIRYRAGMQELQTLITQEGRMELVS